MTTGVKLAQKIFIKGEIEALTGIAIGGVDVGLEIGGVDKVIVRHPITKEPYIPGSSLKGKIRSLLEKLHNLELKEIVSGKIYMHTCENPDCTLCNLFGRSADKAASNTRLIVRDAKCTNIDWLGQATDTELPYAETKTEVIIDRITSAAQPRTFERVPAGAKFDLEMILTLYDGDKEDEYIKMIFEGLRLLQDDYLGGSGSRGYGKVKVHIERIERKTAEDYINGQGAHVANDINIPDELK
ncbi:type III-A CRISPR-associated RAMP protein Csm3 [bacterium]|nr:MAG: type III-A CRISPR-associated RAMP protein Csm3 [bacterium]